MSNDPLSAPVRTWEASRDTDIVIVGAGIAGLAFVLRLPPHLRVIMVTKGALGESNTRYAQGGLAAAVGPDDDPALHFEDTIVAGAGLCDDHAVRTLVEEGPAAVDWLVAHGTVFDEENDGHAPALGKEAAHSRHRVLHAGGDATGAEIERSLVRQLRGRPLVSVLEHTTAIDVVMGQDGSCAGVIVQANDGLERTFVAARMTVLANGGAGQLWAVSSNPRGATGDGVAMALRAGVIVADLEFTQFHPTVLALEGTDPFLVSEAVRGEGAYLRSLSGERFMTDVHPLAELAPRDVVARAIQSQMTESGQDHVHLDLRHLEAERIQHRFPSITERLGSHGIDLARDLIPIAPAAHYFMGGIVAGTDGVTSLPGLLAIGEVSCTGVHGANRLASNSLLEGLVFGLRAADLAAGSLAGAVPVRDSGQPDSSSRFTGSAPFDADAIRLAVQQTMSREVAVVRDAWSLRHALDTLDSLSIPDAPVAGSTSEAELRNMLLLAREVTRSALEREESRGAHFRSDFPTASPSQAGQHLRVVKQPDGYLRSYGSLRRSALPHPVRA
ncbi:MAG TPA: L-aspartate oxidase [Thermomicrobiales bacterium]|nr:L-aspartate oxidase [Thermomicrobiales bacterium]